MFERAKYKETNPSDWTSIENPVGTLKYDGANFFLSFDQEGKMSFISRRPSVKGGYPDRTASLPHLTEEKFPEYAGHVYNVELIHTGFQKNNFESHRVVSGILNSLPPRAIETQQKFGPVRAVMHNVINPAFSTYRQKLLHMKKVEERIGKPDVLFVAVPHITHADIHGLIQRTKVNKQEGVIVTSLTTPEESNPRLKIKHKITYNLRISNIIQEMDKNGMPKDSMGAVEVVDKNNRVVAKVGTGFTRNQRIDAWKNPENWMNRLIQVETMGVAAKMLRMPVYNGDADGDIDSVE